MTTELVNAGTAGGMLALLHGEGGLSIPAPFARSIRLLDSFVTGTFFVKGIESLAQKLREGDRLTLLREPDNRYDRYAIVVKDGAGNKLGYIPRKNNIVLANLMDAGKSIYATLTGKSSAYSSVNLSIGIFMEE
jgi:hypothetical protein